ncbi:MAG: carbohydrate kinase family protein [Sulfobacillus acidophilus]|uniref:Carbohydrate kinase family protein n=1 Tax=Sulfobacillus acidophilus TaxID=53633 RepID=A0A2T2WKG7_9FIRM|nr:MAG: carbohydrate kinase family protein [Sulfobacillus acidophilus]
MTRPMQRNSPTVMLAGHVSLDIMPEIATKSQGFESFRPGGLIVVDGYHIVPGGSVINTGLTLDRLGESVCMVVKIGTDLFGRIFQESLADLIQLRDENPSAVFVREDSVSSTSFTIVVSPQGDDRMFLAYPGTNKTFDVTDIPMDEANHAKVFHFGYPPLLERVYQDGGHSLACLFRSLQQNHVITSLDMCMPGKDSDVDWLQFLRTVLPFVDIFAPSLEEVMLMVAPHRYRQLGEGSRPLAMSITEADLVETAESLLQMGAGVVLIKLGAEGLYVRTGRGLNAPSWANRELYTPCFRVREVGTTGAGDATIGGLLYGILRGLEPEGCVKYSVGVGAHSVEAVDATSGIRTWEEVVFRVEHGWERHRPHPAFETWRSYCDIYRGPRDAN